MKRSQPQKIVAIDSDLQHLVPDYLEARRKDVDTIRSALQNEEYERIGTIGHNLKGSGGGYGFMAISTVGKLLEKGARNRDAGAIERATDVLEAYLGRIGIRYV